MTSPDPLLIRYLLGELDPHEEAALDERAFVDDAWDEERAAAADELIDAYLAGGLTADQRQRFETRFLASSAHRERFRLVRDLRTVVGRGRSGADRARGRARIVWAVAAAVIAALAALVLLTGDGPGREPRIATGPTVVPARTPTPSPAPAGTPTVPPADAPAMVSLPERPQPTRIALDPAARVVRFTIPTASERPDAYIAKVRRDGRTVWEEGDLEASGGAVVVDVPAQALAGESVALALEPDTTRSATPRPPSAARVWILRLVRP